MKALLRLDGALLREDRKSYRRHGFTVPPGTAALEITLSYDPGGELPHSLLTLTLFDPRGFRGAGHRYALRQTVHLGEKGATPGFLAGPIPPGAWTLEVDVHCVIARHEAETRRYRIGVTAVASVDVPAAAAFPRPPEPLVRGRRWYRGELHLHSTHSDGAWTPAEIAELARPRGLDFMVLSDHNTTSSYEEFRGLVAPETLVIPGAELTTYYGHCLAIGVEDWIDWRTGLDGRTIDDVARSVRSAGGLFVVAHPDAMPDDVCTGCRWTHEGFDPALADAVEIWGGLWDGEEEENEGCVALWRRWLEAGYCLAATAATDAHRPKDWEGAVPLTYVLADELSRDAILAAIRAGRTYVSSGPELYLDVDGEGLLARCAGAPEDAELRLVSSGGGLVSGRASGVGSLRGPGGAPWTYAELWSADGSVMLAATSPVYR